MSATNKSPIPGIMHTRHTRGSRYSTAVPAGVWCRPARDHNSLNSARKPAISPENVSRVVDISNILTNTVDRRQRSGKQHLGNSRLC